MLVNYSVKRRYVFLEKLGIIEVYDVGILSFVFVDIVEITEDIDIPIYQEE